MRVVVGLGVGGVGGGGVVVLRAGRTAVSLVLTRAGGADGVAGNTVSAVAAWSGAVGVSMTGNTAKSVAFTRPNSDTGPVGAAGHTISSVSASTGAVGVTMSGTIAKTPALTTPAGADGSAGSGPHPSDVFDIT